MLLPALGNLAGFENSTFADFDFAVWGIIIGNAFTQFGQIIYLSDLSGTVSSRCWRLSASVTSRWWATRSAMRS
ncbi:hypothetical protein LNQ03_10360 [Klebsiella pneumoniae subsp. pneumoniae]|nr:hypothetical protein [Klebsiella pneumoniae subsp. pneumoniae]